MPRGVPRVDDRRVLNGIFWGLRFGAPWRLPERCGRRTTCDNPLSDGAKQVFGTIRCTPSQSSMTAGYR
ncbi:transposase [Aminobacter sp. BA135]